MDVKIRTQKTHEIFLALSTVHFLFCSNYSKLKKGSILVKSILQLALLAKSFGQ